MLAGTLSGIEMGLRLAGVPHRPGGVMAALDSLARAIGRHASVSEPSSDSDRLPLPAQLARQTDRFVRRGRRPRAGAEAGGPRRGALRSREPRAVRHRRIELPSDSRSASSCRAMPTMWSRRWRRAGSSTRRCCRGAPAPASPANAATSRSCFDFTKYMNRILEIDPVGRFARVQPGVVLDSLRNAAEAHQLTFGPDPSTHSRCTLGGMIGNNSCGTHSLLAGKTVDNVEELEILLYDGTRLTVGATSDGELDAIVGGGRTPRRDLRRPQSDSRSVRRIRSGRGSPQFPGGSRATTSTSCCPEHGFNVARALVGTRRHLRHRARSQGDADPQSRSTDRWSDSAIRDAFAAADHVPEILEFQPIGLEGFEGNIIDGLHKKGAPNLDLIPDGRGVLLVEFGFDNADEAAGDGRAVHRADAADSRRADDPAVLDERSARDVEDPRIGAARRRGGARRAARVGRLGRRGGRAGEAGRLSARPAGAAGRISLSDRVLRPLRPRLHPHAGELRPRSPRTASGSTASSSSARRTWSSATAARSRENMATANRAARCCRRCSAAS